MSSQPRFPPQDANYLQRGDPVTHELNNDLDEYLTQLEDAPDSSYFDTFFYQGSTPFTFEQPPPSQMPTQYIFKSMDAIQINYDASQILDDKDGPGYSGGSNNLSFAQSDQRHGEEDEGEEARGNLGRKTALIRTLTLQLSEANKEIEKLNCEIEEASDQTVIQVENISRLQTENQKLTDELEKIQKALSERKSASNECDVGPAHNQAQNPSSLQLEVAELKGKLEDAMKASQGNYDGWVNADKQWKVEWTASKEESKANYDGWTAANNEAKQNWERYVRAAKNLKKEEVEVKRLREIARQVSHGASTSSVPSTPSSVSSTPSSVSYTPNSASLTPSTLFAAGRKWTDSQRDSFADRKVRNAVEFKNQEILKLKSKLAQCKELPEEVSPLTPIPVAKAKDSEVVELETRVSQLRKERDTAVESYSNKLTRMQQLESQIQFSNDVAIHSSRISTIQRWKSECEQYRATGRKYKSRNAKITWTVQFLEKQSKNARAAGRRSAAAEASMLADNKQLKKNINKYEDKCQQLEAAAKEDQSTIQQGKDELKQLQEGKEAAETSFLNQKKNQDKRIEKFSEFESKLRAGFSQLHIPVNLDDHIDVTTFTYLRHVNEALEAATVITSYNRNPEGPLEQYIPDSATLIQSLQEDVIRLNAQLNEVEAKLALVAPNPKSDSCSTDEIQEGKSAAGKTESRETSLEGETKTTAQMGNAKVEDQSSEGKPSPGRSFGFSYSSNSTYSDESNRGDDGRTKDDFTSLLSTSKIANIDGALSHSTELNPCPNLANSSSTRRLRKVTFVHDDNLETVIPQPVYPCPEGQSFLPKQEGLNKKDFLGLVLANPASTQFPRMTTFAKPKKLESIVPQPNTLEMPEKFPPPTGQETLRQNEPKTVLIPNSSPETIATDVVDDGTRDPRSFLLLILLTCIAIGPMLVWGYLDVEAYALSLLCNFCTSFQDQISWFLIVTCMLCVVYFRGEMIMRMLPDA